MKVPNIDPRGSGDEWLLEDPWPYFHNDINGVVPAGFLFDLASIPKFARSLVQKSDRRTWGPAVEHDWRYVNNLGKRLNADWAFYKALRVNGISFIKSMAMFMAVRVAGGLYWDKRQAGKP